MRLQPVGDMGQQIGNFRIVKLSQVSPSGFTSLHPIPSPRDSAYSGATLWTRAYAQWCESFAS